jgi:hypothetical protein
MGQCQNLAWLDSTARRSPESQILARELADGGAPHQFHVALYFGSHEAQRPLDPSLAGCGQRIEIKAADTDCLGAHRERLQDMSPPLHSAVHQHIDPVAHGIHDFGQLVE